jgi:hypothetical protein
VRAGQTEAAGAASADAPPVTRTDTEIAEGAGWFAILQVVTSSPPICDDIVTLMAMVGAHPWVARHHHAMVAPSPSCRSCAVLQSEFGIDLGWDFRTGCAARREQRHREQRHREQPGAAGSSGTGSSGTQRNSCHSRVHSRSLVRSLACGR